MSTETVLIIALFLLLFRNDFCNTINISYKPKPQKAKSSMWVREKFRPK